MWCTANRLCSSTGYFDLQLFHLAQILLWIINNVHIEFSKILAVLGLEPHHPHFLWGFCGETFLSDRATMVHFDRLMSFCLIKMFHENIHLLRADGIHNLFLPCQNLIVIIVLQKAWSTSQVSLVTSMEHDKLSKFLSDNSDFIVPPRFLLNFFDWSKWWRVNKSRRCGILA